jgi:sugar (pentulose or hexulose) kinase
MNTPLGTVSTTPAAAASATLVLDIGKTHAKLFLIGPQGEVLQSLRTRNQPVPDAAHGTTALDTGGLQDWLLRSVPEVLQGRVPGRVIATTHGAAFCALDDDGLVLPPIDYEWDGYGDVTAEFDASLDDFAHHGTPRLPQGLNAGRQIDFVHRRWPALAQRIRHWLPYPQYWAWWLSGAACSEVSSLGCHTGLWAPAAGRFSDWAVSAGLAGRFAPLRRAWDVVGTLRPALAQAWRLPAGVQVVAGAHDSNACLARYLPDTPQATVVSTGTWCIVMAPGAPADGLAPQCDELVNVAVDGRAVPTARFIGGREHAVLCDGTDPQAATPQALSALLQQGWMALPAFAGSGGPFAGQVGSIWRQGAPEDGGVGAVPTALRPALAALYCANVTARLVRRLARAPGASAPVIVEGPLAHNTAYRQALAGLLAGHALWCSVDPLEGTARGAWMLAHWGHAATPAGQAPALHRVAEPAAALAAALRAQDQAWQSQVQQG